MKRANKPDAIMSSATIVPLTPRILTMTPTATTMDAKNHGSRLYLSTRALLLSRYVLILPGCCWRTGGGGVIVGVGGARWDGG